MQISIVLLVLDSAAGGRQRMVQVLHSHQPQIQVFTVPTQDPSKPSKSCVVPNCLDFTPALPLRQSIYAACVP
eukprot:3730171-Amphidinium_carterae.1